MGGEPYEYFVEYQKDIGAALEKLREDVFKSGKYNGSQYNPETPEEAVRLTEPDGTRSILDIEKLSDTPDYSCAAPLTNEELLKYFNTNKPSRSMIIESDNFWDDLERGKARYIIVYENDNPKEIFFGGYSFD